MVKKKQLKKLIHDKQNTKVDMTYKELEELLLETQLKATTHAIDELLVFPLWVLRRQFGFGAGRLHKFQDELKRQLQMASDGYVSMHDVRVTMAEEVRGITFEKGEDK